MFRLALRCNMRVKQLAPLARRWRVASLLANMLGLVPGIFFVPHFKVLRFAQCTLKWNRCVRYPGTSPWCADEFSTVCRVGA